MTLSAKPSEIAAAKLKIAIAKQRGEPIDPLLEEIARATPSTENVRAYLDGGPANGVMVEVDEPHWAPLGALRIEVDGQEFVYVRADQPRPPDGMPWRYVPEQRPKSTSHRPTSHPDPGQSSD
jgi:hypothetical protein